MDAIRLTLEEDGRESKQLSFTQETEITIGRASNNTIVLNSSNVSRNHCRIFFTGDSWSAEDLGSTNGIQVNEESRKTTKLNHNDVISIRPFTIKISLIPLIHDETLAEEAMGDATIFDASDGANREDILGKTQDFLLVTSGISVGHTFPLLNETLIGSSEDCDVKLRDQGVFPRHVFIEAYKHGYKFKTLNDAIVLQNGKQVADGKLKDTDVLTVANVNMTLRLEQKSISNTSFSGFRRKNLRVLGLSGLLLMLITLLIFSFKDTNQSSKKNESTAASDKQAGLQSNTVMGPSSVIKEDPQRDQGATSSLEEKRQVSKLIYQAEQYIAEGAFEKAMHRLKAALQINPSDAKASQLQTQVLEAIETKRKEEVQKIARLESFKADATDRFKQVEQMLIKGDLTSAREVVEDIQRRSEEFGNVQEIHETIESLKGKIAKQEVDKNNKKILRKNSFEEQLEALKQEIDSGLISYKNGDLYQARVHWLRANASQLEVAEKQQVRKYLEELEKTLSDEIKVAFEKANAATKTGDRPVALFYYDRILKNEPTNSEAKKQVENILPAQEKEAKHLYQEGLVYEGINNIDRAISDWKSALKALPVEDKEYHIKSRKKLSEYGVK